MEKYIKGQLDRTNFWIAITGMILLVLNLHNFLFFAFLLLILLPEGQITSFFSSASKKIKDLDTNQ